ncbi:MAG: protein kinase family protein [Elainellaceae cyanobacterium]
MTGSQLLGSRYQFVQLLSSSESGKTYLVTDSFFDDQPKRVVKQLPLQGKTPKAMSFILMLLGKKAEALKHMGTHDQIPKIIDYFEENKSFYLVEEYIEGRSLVDLLKPGQRLPEEVVQHLLQEILKILLVVHGWGVIHRSIKPSSIIQRQNDGKLVLTGFGVFKEISAQSGKGSNGSEPHSYKSIPVYMPPEQGNGKRQFNHDIYAVGMIGIQALTGLSAEDLQQLRQTRTSQGGVPESLSWLNYARASPGFCKLLDRMTHLQVKRRYNTAAGVLEDLKSIADQPHLAPPTPGEALGFQAMSQPMTSEAAETLSPLQFANGSAPRVIAKKQPTKKRSSISRTLLVLLALGGLGLVAGLLLNQVPQRLWAAYNLRQGQTLEAQGDEETAIAQYTRAISIFPSAQAYLNRGLAYYQTDQWQMAQDDLTQAIELDDSNTEAYFSRGNIRYGLGDRQGAIEDYTSAIQHDPTVTRPYVNRGTVRADLGDDQGAIEDYSQAIQNDPSLAAAYLNRCLSRSNLGDHQGAIADCVQASRLEPNSVEAFQNRGLVRRRLGDPVGAIEDFNIAINLDPQDADPYYNRGLARLEVGDLDGAIADYTQAIELDSSHALAFYDRGMAQWELGNVEAAIADLEKSAKLCLDSSLIDCYEDAQYQIQRIQASAEP